MKIVILLLSLLLLVASSAVSSAPFDRLLMPGKLVASHKKIEIKCDNCHEAFDKKMQNKLCLDCHKKVNKDVDDSKGFHGKNKLVKKKECKYCHTDHIGRDANIVNINKLSFDHKSTDFQLKGAHKSLACDSCHASDKKYRDTLHLCYDCHKSDDSHKKRLGKKCQDCHSEKNWKKTKFDHDKTEYKLEGKHKKVVCGECHPNQRYKATPHKCAACHKVQDVHRGEFGNGCEKCHNSSKWKKILFDHDKETKFKLRFRHEKISCGSCHVKNAYKFELKKDCYSCHKADDKHATKFGKKCDSCHQVKSWEKIKFDHDKDTSFKLLDSHKKVICKNCHEGNIFENEDNSGVKKATKNTASALPIKKKKARSCVKCHDIDDVHNAKLGKKCNSCHSQKNWAENIVFEHDLTSFPLIGLHGITSCDSCHSSTEYKMEKSSCYSCHKSEDVHKLTLTSQCETCHTPNGWKVWLFSHNDQTDYKLDGEHELLECVACHREPIKKNKKIVLSDKCENCHSEDDVHSGQFGNRCGKCHSTDSFKNIAKLN